MLNFARVWEGENPREEITNPKRLYPDRYLQADFSKLPQSLLVVIVTSIRFRIVHTVTKLVCPEQLVDVPLRVRVYQIVQLNWRPFDSIITHVTLG